MRLGEEGNQKNKDLQKKITIAVEILSRTASEVESG